MAPRYTRESLAEAVRGASSLAEVINSFGGEPTRGSLAYLRRLVDRWGIDIAHIERPGVRYTERRLREAVSGSTSIAEVVRRLGLCSVGGNHAHIGRRITSLGIDTSHFTGVGRARRQSQPLLTLRTPEDRRVAGERLRRALLSVGVPEECAECGTGPWWNGKPLRLEVDHINAQWWDNRRENLRLLCPNCHAITDTYRRRTHRGRTEGEPR